MNEFWVLVSKNPPRRNNAARYFYYTGVEPAKKIRHAAQFNEWEKAKATQKYAKTGAWYRPMKVTKKQIFKMSLNGR